MKNERQIPALEVERLSVRAGNRSLVEDVSFDARAGEVTVVIGPNGAGKTSLLEALLGLRESETGSVRWAGKPLVGFRERARTFAYLPDQSELPNEVSVRTLVEHALRHGAGKVQVEEIRRLLAIDALLSSGAGVLSRGERQRVQLFCTLALGRSAVVLDEPFGAFDPLQLRGVCSAVRRVTQSGAAVVASIHQLGDAERIADRVLLLAEGKALAFGTPSELRVAAGSPEATSGTRGSAIPRPGVSCVSRIITLLRWTSLEYEPSAHKAAQRDSRLRRHPEHGDRSSSVSTIRRHRCGCGGRWHLRARARSGAALSTG